MRAAQYHEYGDESVLTVRDVDKPSIESGEILVKTEAASVNPIDTYIREGDVKPTAGLPHIPGADLAGVVAETADDVNRFSAGDRVFATGLGLFSQGSYAEYVAVPQEHAAILPEEITFDSGAAAAMAFATSWRALINRGDLQIGDIAVIHGASGGVGHAAVQVADAAGAYVVGTAREGDPSEFVYDCGADAVVDYRSEHLADELNQVTDTRNVDVILDTHADIHLDANLQNLSRNGNIVVIGEKDTISFDGAISMRAKQTDANVRFMSIMASADDQASILSKVAEKLSTGDFSVKIDRTYSLAEISKAHQKVMDSSNIGKVVINI
ncbi:NADPH:quinone reductase [Salinarchaeum sp. IM2453]|uniref:NADPH:quinone reductase n=1 Tax=Salinarchaeum sp. IM2453 TaxID=2862870 RepID=UPI001C8376AE|nr:NADPH:quinone reductase [Salinarchaeum sp. IM2453]QZA88554.1 NADPH:quinone reductase [Salinarchaeum sp. IM2453]